MAGQPPSNEAFELPRLRTLLKTSTENPDSEENHFWTVKFYPFDLSPDATPVFAIPNEKNIMVCRIGSDQDNNVEILAVFDNELNEQYGDHMYCACEWAFINPDEPLLLGAGDEGGLIQVYDVVNGCLKFNLQGHSRGIINDLATHPKYPWIVASVSQDNSIRVWDLRRWDNKHESPCVVICGHGNGHRETPLGVSWHANGRYLISGGHDQRICIWTVPDLSPDSTFWEEISPSQRKRSSHEVRLIHYPHFVSSALHTNFVDCVRFWGDLVLSKAAEENKIVLWSITGFNSRNPPPDAILAPKIEEYLDTRNGFIRSLSISDQGVHTIAVDEPYKHKLPYTRLLEFAVPAAKPFFIRFDLLQPSPAHPNLHPILAIGNHKSQVLFWDLEALEIGHNPLFPAKPPPKKKSAALTPKRQMANKSSFAPPSPSSSRQSSSLFPRRPSTDNVSPSAASPSLLKAQSPHRPPQHQDPHQQPQHPQTLLPDRTHLPLHQSRKPLDATKTYKVPDVGPDFQMRGVSWSPDGKWCVLVGEIVERVRGAKGEAVSESELKVGTGSKVGKVKGMKGGLGNGEKGAGGVSLARSGEVRDVQVGVAAVFGRWLEES